MRKTVGYLTASGFLSAILIFWAQLWFSLKPDGGFDWASSLGLAWTYLAVILALVGSVAVVIQDLASHHETDEEIVPHWTIWLLGIAIGMALVDILLSLISNILHLVNGAASIPYWMQNTLHWSEAGTKVFFYVGGPIVILLIVAGVWIVMACIQQHRTRDNSQVNRVNG